ncbi:unnamed protein product [Medioppia subpectinata]|uniref:carbonic anhydrase n=1 Tax=Medioppia subpectinata TaxID=1979941 RepID=A0A7R9KPF8_9ACAR|nr:unnamed protein product [Medioppia subpectinata]CAG2107370.1 unnamed protein product [Medioppia subpectinata]
MAQLHFHWSDHKGRGSEHAFSGVHYSMEMHIVHYNKKYDNISEAGTHPDGLAVLGVMFEITRKANPHLDAIIEGVKAVKVEGGDDYHSTPPQYRQNAGQPLVNLENLLPNDLKLFFRYKGSLTTPPCAESVTWLVFHDTTDIGLKQIKAFRELTDSHKVVLSDTFRQLQALNDRRVEASQPVRDGTTGAATYGTNVIITNHLKLVPDHWCRVNELSNFSYGEQHRFVRPVVRPSNTSADVVRDSCHMFDIDYKQVLNDLRLPPVNESIKCHKKLAVKTCADGWVYDTGYYWDSFAMHYDFVCENSHRFAIIPTIRTIASVCGTPLFGLIADLFTPESLQWLLSKAKYNLVVKSFKHIMQTNSKSIDEDLLSMQVQKIGKTTKPEELAEESETTTKVKHIHKAIVKFLRETTLFQCLLILTLCLAVNLSAKHIFETKTIVLYEKEMIINDIMWSLARIPAIFMVWFLMQRRIGRRLTNALLLAAIGLILVGLLVTKSEQMKYWLSTCGLLLTTPSLMVISLQVIEMSPTTFRCSALTAILSIATLAVTIVQHLFTIDNYDNHWLYLVVVSSMAFVTSFLSTFLMETLRENTPQTVVSAEKLLNDMKYWKLGKRKCDLKSNIFKSLSTWDLNDAEDNDNT